MSATLHTINSRNFYMELGLITQEIQEGKSVRIALSSLLNEQHEIIRIFLQNFGSKITQIDVANDYYLASLVEKIEMLKGKIVGIPIRAAPPQNDSAPRVEQDLFYAGRDEAGCGIPHRVTINPSNINQILSKIERSKNHSSRDLRFNLILQDLTVFEDQKRLVMFLISNPDIMREIDLKSHPISDVLKKLVLQAVGAMNSAIRLHVDLSPQLLNDSEVQEALKKALSNKTYISCPLNSALEWTVRRLTEEIEAQKPKKDNWHALQRMFE